MTAYKQAGISVNRALAIAAKVTRASLKAKEKAAVAGRGFGELKAVRITNGVQGEPMDLKI